MSREMHPSASASASASYSPNVVTIIERRPKTILKPRPKSDFSSRLVQIWPKDPQPGNPEHWSAWRRWKDVFTGKGPDIYVERERRTQTRTRRCSYSYSESQRHGDRDNGPYSDNYVHKEVRFDLDERSPRSSRSPSPGGFHIGRPGGIRGGPSGGNAGELTPSRGDGYANTGWSLWHKDHLKWCRVRNCDVCEQILEQERKDNAFFWARRPSDDRYDHRTRTYGIPDLGTWSGKVYCDDPSHVVPRQYWDKDRRALPENLYHDIVHGAHEDRRQRRRRVSRYDLFR
ncbi:uncharacterized protein DSM5745_09055 [Aspergillus mulundensis]|uniref:Uncharacterized protein n=1 Tax=Aspergillus mulundensis TaxID=1810919 RepID=A0A3D8QZH9_9EURO|nr:hypothetical protein DSM5745_09055 [Aspergillus mulundensis]RDW67189.1 hypothetical protein DSM5745_09055 [Aspergillus mulundensis]